MRIGIDLGGTKIAAIALEHGDELVRLRIETPRGDYDRTVGAICGLVSEIERLTGQRGSVGIGIPGTVSLGTGLVKNANSTWLIGRPLQADLESKLERPVRIANDANCFVVSEATDGAAAGAEVAFGVIVGTGCGAGVAVRGGQIVGEHGIAGEWGHNPLPWMRDEERPGPPCYCGQRGCIETFLSGSGLARDYEADTGRALTAEQLAGRPDAEPSLLRYEDRMARALASIINILDPQVIVLGGGMSNLARLYRNVPQRWAAYVFAAGARDEPVRTRLVPARHGDASGVRGAAWLWS